MPFMKYPLHTRCKKLLADTLTPVNIYLKLRDVFAGSILLESSDYHGHENSLSFICCDPVASFCVNAGKIEMRFPDGKRDEILITEKGQLWKKLDEFRKAFIPGDSQLKYNPAGLFGYMTYDTVQYFEDVKVSVKKQLIPEVLYKAYRFVIVVDHFSNELTLFENSFNESENSSLETLEKIICSNRFSTFSFSSTGQEESQMSDEDYKRMVRDGISHCHRGDVFQIVLSRRFSCGFQGDEFNVYRALRSVNPSPYLFYFDFGSFKIFGSSPEAQIRITKGEAAIYPIAGTIRRSGNDKEDAELAERLAHDEKENAEHVMLVDLARNDLSRDSREVKVEVFKEFQFYSHVIHLVSKVTGQLHADASPLKMVADTFPAGTLSGAPKPMAMTLIDKFEPVNRSFYGGAIGFLGFNGDFNHAIMIRTFLSKANQLTFQAGAGIVAKSIPENELQEVNNKLEALRKAIKIAEEL